MELLSHLLAILSLYFRCRNLIESGTPISGMGKALYCDPNICLTTSLSLIPLTTLELPDTFSLNEDDLMSRLDGMAASSSREPANNMWKTLT